MKTTLLALILATATQANTLVNTMVATQVVTSTALYMSYSETTTRLDNHDTLLKGILDSQGSLIEVATKQAAALKGDK